MKEERQTRAAEAARQRTAIGLRQRFEWLNSFTDEELRRIAACDEGQELVEGEAYFDLSRPERGVLTGLGGTVSPPGSCYVARSKVDPPTWEKMIRGFAAPPGRG